MGSRPDTGAKPAVEELRSDPASRKRFLKMVGGSGAVAAFGVLLAACGGDDEETASTSPSDTSMTGEAAEKKSGVEQFGDGDIGIANYALTLEFLEAAFYVDVIESGLFKGSQLDLIKEIGQNEQDHVDALAALIDKSGGKPAAKPQTKFPLDSADSVLALAATVENLGAAAYLGQAGAIKDKQVLAAALSIHTVEARHAATLNTLVGKSPTPDGAFSKPATAEEVLKSVKQFILA